MKKPLEIRPPKWPLKLLRFFLKKEYLEEIEGDMEELFYDNAEQYSLRQARRIYTMEMLKLIRPSLIRHVGRFTFINQHAMFKNYFKVSFRGLMKSPLNTSINIFGLAAAIGFCMLVYGFARWTISTDQFHEHKNEVYLTTFFANRDGSQQEYGKTPRPLGEMLKSDFAQISKVCRVEDRNVVIKYGDHVFHESVRFTDPEFLEMFTFPLQAGTATSLKDVNSIILSHEMARKYFGEGEAIGQSILMKFDQTHEKVFRVTGVAEDFPKAITIDFGFLINFENLRTSDGFYDFQDWEAFVNGTFIQVDDPKDLRSIAAGMRKYRDLQNQAVKEDWAITSFGFQPLATLNIESEHIKDGISWSTDSNYKSIIFLTIVGVFMLVLACFNYINIAIVSAAKRLKEIGVRKSIGASRRVVIVQFLTENLVIMSLALVSGLAFGAFVVIPWFEHMNQFSMGFTLNDKNLLIFLPAILFFTGILSGAYPAFYVSSFQVVGILKGSVRFGQKNPLTKLLLGFQLILACAFITSAVMFTQNSSYLAKRSWGYDPGATLYALLPDQKSYEELHSAMLMNPDVISLSGSAHHLGKKNTSVVIHREDRDYEVDQLAVDANYFGTMGIQVLNGRGFNNHEGSDRHAVVVNEILVKNMIWENPIGQTFTIDTTVYEVVGVVKNFHHQSFTFTLKPSIFTVVPGEEQRYLTMKVREGAETKTYKSLQSKWTELFPEIPFDGGHQEDVWGTYFSKIENHGRVWRGIAYIAVLVAGLGLYGLMKLNVEGRVREFSIRKVLGAGIRNIAANISNQYLILFGVALLIGTPFSYWLIKTLFDYAYPYHMPVDFSGASIAASILIIVLLITIMTQVRKVSKDSPVRGLKTE